MHYTAGDILSQTRCGSMLIRVHDGTSISPLQRDGFTASNGYFDQMDIFAFDELYRDFAEELLENPVKTLVNKCCCFGELTSHVLGGWGPGSTAHKPSPWISTTFNFEWAVYEVVRRLTRLGRDKVHMTLIKRVPSHHPDSDLKAIYVAPTDFLLTDAYAGGCVGLADRAKAFRFAGAASEVLMYGRIFREDILETGRWTANTTGTKLPAWMFVPRSQCHNVSEWIDRLVWDPVNDDFATAALKMRQRRYEVTGKH